jgi:hypothetical protein
VAIAPRGRHQRLREPASLRGCFQDSATTQPTTAKRLSVEQPRRRLQRSKTPSEGSKAHVRADRAVHDAQVHGCADHARRSMTARGTRPRIHATTLLGFAPAALAPVADGAVVSLRTGQATAAIQARLRAARTTCCGGPARRRAAPRWQARPRRTSLARAALCARHDTRAGSARSGRRCAARTRAPVARRATLVPVLLAHCATRAAGASCGVTAHLWPRASSRARLASAACELGARARCELGLGARARARRERVKSKF